jgi:hypothetical protein
VSSDDYDYFEERYSEQARKKAQEIFDNPPDRTSEEYDFKKFFTKILNEPDWTDKLESAIGKVRNRFHLPTPDRRPEKPHPHPPTPRRRGSKKTHPPNKDTVLSKELKSLIPDMKEVAKAYHEMTTVYKEFIQNVLEAKQSRASKAKKKIERDKSIDSPSHSSHHK